MENPTTHEGLHEFGNPTKIEVYMGKSWENPTTKKGLHGKFMGNPTKIDVHMGNSWENHTKMTVSMLKSVFLAKNPKPLGKRKIILLSTRTK